MEWTSENIVGIVREGTQFLLALAAVVAAFRARSHAKDADQSAFKAKQAEEAVTEKVIYFGKQQSQQSKDGG